MSAILGVFTSAAALPDEPMLAAMLHAMRRRGADATDIWRAGHAALGVSRFAWEQPGAPADSRLLLADDELVVVTDAALYYRDDLQRRLREQRVAARGTSATHLVAAAYRAWGAAAAAQLEGDFAFIIWDRIHHRVCAARDFGGKRTLFHAQVGEVLIVASTIGGVLAYPGCPGALDPDEIAATAAGLFSAPSDTCYQAVRRLPAGNTLIAAPGESARVAPHWSPPPVVEDASLAFDDAAVELRRLLGCAVAERMDPGSSTSIWLSGGWDSPAVFGVGQEILRTRHDAGSLLPVSMSYPPGDPGRENELIEAVAGAWQVAVQWMDIGEVPLFDDAFARAAERDEPFAHAFEMWLRALARGSRAVGSHVALDGMGGDQLFQLSDVYLADLLRGFRWLELAREARARRRGGRPIRDLLRQVVQPLLSPRAGALVAWLRGGRGLSGYLEPVVPVWMREEFLRAHGLLEREHAYIPMRGRRNSAAYETHWYLSHPYFPRVFGCVAAIALEEGVELRSPLYDRRIIEFAVRRPRRERASHSGTKLLLRHAVRDLVPASVLAPRERRTGITSAYFARSLRAEAGPIVERALSASALAAAGMIDAERFRAVWRRYLGPDGEEPSGNFFSTLQTELWLRAHISSSVDESGQQVQPEVGAG
ncbi:MAG: asparagine synthase-related protein [Gemmatimonadaceae bacterium]